MFVELMPLLAGRTVLITVAKVDDKTTHLSILNSTYESSDVGRHQYLCGFERNEGSAEDDT